MAKFYKTNPTFWGGLDPPKRWLWGGLCMQRPPRKGAFVFQNKDVLGPGRAPASGTRNGAQSNLLGGLGT